MKEKDNQNDDDDILSPQEKIELDAILDKIDAGDFSEFDDWEVIKHLLE